MKLCCFWTPNIFVYKPPELKTGPNQAYRRKLLSQTDAADAEQTDTEHKTFRVKNGLQSALYTRVTSPHTDTHTQEKHHDAKVSFTPVTPQV